MREFATGDDSVWCRICDPPYETSVAMLALHLVEVHGIDPDEIANAPVVDSTSHCEAVAPE